LARPLPELSRVWWSIDLPGFRPHAKRYATYSPFAYDELPPVGRALDNELAWLLREKPVRGWLADEDWAEPIRRATLAELADLWPEGWQRTPAAFRAFVGGPGPARRIRSATGCYLDLGQFAVPAAEGGKLVHFLSDQQGVLHWLLFVDDGQEAVVVTYRPYGFEQPEAPVPFTQRRHSAVCAESFSEFLYRFWIENEIWFRLCTGWRRQLTAEQRAYVAHYRRG
jgi:hypothetical protein